MKVRPLDAASIGGSRADEALEAFTAIVGGVFLQLIYAK